MQLQKAFFEDTQIEDLEIQSDFPVIGHRNIMVSTTRIHSQDNVVPFILLTFNDVTKSKKAEDSTGFEKQLLDAAGQAIIATDLDGAIIYWNRFAETLYGWSTPDVMGRNIVDVNAADTWRQQDNEAISNLANDECLSSEYLERRQDGTTFPVFVAATPLRDNNGQQIGIVTVSKDITERKQAQEALRKSEQRFRALVENSADGIAINSGDRSALLVSPSVTRLLGYSLEEYYGMKRNDLVHPDDRELVQREWDELLREPGKVVKTEQRVRHKDGSWRWIERISHNLLDDPSVKGIVGNFRDITEQKQAEEDLRESEGRFRSFFEQSLVGMAITAIDKGVILVNDKLCEMLGYSREEMLNLSWPDITHLDDLAADVAQFNRVIAGEIDGYSIDKRFIRKDGRTINVIMICRCLRDGATKVMHFVALVQDITERKQAEEKIKEQNRRLEILLKFSEQSIGQINMTSLLISLARSTLDILLAAEAVSVFLFDEHLGRLIFRGWASHGEGQVDSATVLYHTRLAELIYQSGNLQIVGDMSRQPMLVYWWQLQGSMLGLPLPVDGKSLGVLIATNTSKRYAFDDENSQWLQTLAVHAITAIQNVGLFEQVISERDRARQLGA